MIKSKDIPWDDVHVLADWLERANGSSDHEQAVQIMKIAEEIQEFMEASAPEVASELCDVALTALVALRGWTRKPEKVRHEVLGKQGLDTDQEYLFAAYGQLCAIYIGFLGQNPRKGRTHSAEDVQAALAEVAARALHVLRLWDANPPERFRKHLAHVVERAGLSTADSR
jgi:hypothetical protein